jgi:hypothetical protein
MKKILFYAHQLNYRGTTNSLVDYAEYNQSVLGNESTIIYNVDFNEKGLDILSDDAVISSISKRFNVIPYHAGPEDDFRELDKIASKYDLFYFQKAGLAEEPDIKSTKTANHAVFQYCDPHGDRYAYISEWLSKEAKKNNGVEIPFVPYIVNLPQPNKDLRAELGIPKDKFVFGRHGGVYTFDKEFTWKAVAKIANERDDIVFLFANTRKMYEHPNIIYLEPFFGNQEKSNFINACDAMIPGRDLGESFGGAICEFLFFNKPVLAWEGGFDGNHRLLLGPSKLLYNEENIDLKMNSLKQWMVGKDFKQIVEPFSPENIMKKFDEVFIK